MEDHEITLRLKWRQTWTDRENDYVAETPTYNGSIGRIYLYEAGPQQGQWFWAMNAHDPHISRNIGALSGCETSARRAGKAVEDAWFAAIRGTLHEQGPKPSVNAYRVAKGV